MSATRRKARHVRLVFTSRSIFLLVIRGLYSTMMTDSDFFIPNGLLGTKLISSFPALGNTSKYPPAEKSLVPSLDSANDELLDDSDLILKST